MFGLEKNLMESEDCMHTDMNLSKFTVLYVAAVGPSSQTVGKAKTQIPVSNHALKEEETSIG